MKKIIAFLFFALLTLSVIPVKADTPEEIYERLKSGNGFNSFLKGLDKESISEKAASSGQAVSEWLWNAFDTVYYTFKSLFPLVVGFSVILGIALLLIVRRDKAFIKKTITTFFILIPLIMVIIVFIIPSLKYISV